MSLKAFHIFFISVSILLALYFGVWAIRHYQTSLSGIDLAMGIGSLIGGFALAYYLWRFYIRRPQ